MFYKIKEGVTSVEEDGELVLFDLFGEKFFGLDEIGSLIWGKLEDNMSVVDISKEIVSLYNIPIEQATSDINTFLKTLSQKELVKKV